MPNKEMDCDAVPFFEDRRIGMGVLLACRVFDCDDAKISSESPLDAVDVRRPAGVGNDGDARFPGASGFGGGR